MRKILCISVVDEKGGVNGIPYGTILIERNEITTWEIRPEKGEEDGLLNAAEDVVMDLDVDAFINAILEDNLEASAIEKAGESLKKLIENLGDRGTIEFNV